MNFINKNIKNKRWYFLSNTLENMYISDILINYPETYSIFNENGFENFTYEELTDVIGPFLRLKTALKTRKINNELFIKLLQEKVDEGDNITQVDSVEADNLNLLALLPCPLKVPLEEAFNKFLKKSGIKEKHKLKYLIESNANNQLSYNKYVSQFESIDDIPDIVISSGVNCFYSKSFVKKFIDKDLFVDVAAADYISNKSLEGVGIKDPGGNYTIFSMNILVMVADLTKIGELPLPETWGDLLVPEYNKKVVIRGQKNNFCETTLLAVYKEYGYEGIKNLGRSVMAGWHPAQMVKMAGTGREDAPAISVMPYFYTRTIKNKDKVKVIWPKDGAIISPVTMLVKKSKYNQLKEIAEFFTGTEAGRICAGAYFPALNPEVDNKIPEDAAFNWIGWDFIKSKDMSALVDDLNRIFLEGFVQTE